MTRLRAALRSARRVNWWGVVRVTFVAGAGVGLVYAATVTTVELDLAAATGEDRDPVVGTALASRTEQICPGQELTGIDGAPDIPVPGSISAALAPADLLPAPPTGPGSLELGPASTPIAEVGSRTDVATAPLPASGPVAVVGQGALAPGVAATQEWLLDRKDLRGLASVPCAPAAADLWLLAGGSGAGRQERLVLTNPGANPVSADVTVHGASGPLGDPRVETVPAGGRVSLLLDGLRAGEESPAVHVRADGGGLNATLTDTWVAGSTALGAETVAAVAEPGTVQVLPGVIVDLATSVRVVVPGEQDAVVRLTVLGPDGLVPLAGETVANVGAGSVGEIAVTGLPTGTYAVAVRSDVDVVAAASSQVGDGATPGEFAWTTSAEPLTSAGGAALPPTATVTRDLRLVATGGASTADVVTVVGERVVTQRVDLIQDHTASISLNGATSVWVKPVSGGGALRGTIVSTSGSGPGRLVSAMQLLDSVVASPVSRAFPLP